MRGSQINLPGAGNQTVNLLTLSWVWYHMSRYTYSDSWYFTPNTWEKMLWFPLPMSRYCVVGTLAPRSRVLYPIHTMGAGDSSRALLARDSPLWYIYLINHRTPLEIQALLFQYSPLPPLYCYFTTHEYKTNDKHS